MVHRTGRDTKREGSLTLVYTVPERKGERGMGQVKCGSDKGRVDSILGMYTH